jgi:hypothetical protein
MPQPLVSPSRPLLNYRCMLSIQFFSTPYTILCHKALFPKIKETYSSTFSKVARLYSVLFLSSVSIRSNVALLSSVSFLSVLSSLPFSSFLFFGTRASQ